MKIGLICDSHMPYNNQSSQWHFCSEAAKAFLNNNISRVITIGDITSFGEVDAFDEYQKLFSQFEHYCVLGNSDARDKDTLGTLEEKCSGFIFIAEGKTILGINTSCAAISDADKDAISSLSDGDILVMHHPVDRLFEESDREFMNKICESKNITILCAHLHRKLYSEKGKSKLYGIRAIDPDKSFGDFPCVTVFDTETNEIEEILIEVSVDAIFDARKHFGISCVDNHRDVEYATNKKLYGVELRCNGKGWEPDLTLIPKINKWRESGGKYLSIHMPNLYWVDGALVGAETWYKAVEYAKAVGADGLTMHPPRVKLRDFKNSESAFLELYIFAVKALGSEVFIGVENLHMTKGETCDEDRAFGYIPSEVLYWKQRIAEACPESKNIGHTLDVGHARNNGYLASKYPISRWYETLGREAKAYHIHQVMMKEEGLKNHNAIEHWFGPQISYASFFSLWEREQIKHSAIFLEVKGSENFEKSIVAFENRFGRKEGL